MSRVPIHPGWGELGQITNIARSLQLVAGKKILSQYIPSKLYWDNYHCSTHLLNLLIMLERCPLREQSKNSFSASILSLIFSISSSVARRMRHQVVAIILRCVNVYNLVIILSISFIWHHPQLHNPLLACPNSPQTTFGFRK